MVEGDDEGDDEGDGEGCVAARVGAGAEEGSLLNGSAGRLADIVTPHRGQIGSVVVVLQLPQFVGSS